MKQFNLNDVIMHNKDAWFQFDNGKLYCIAGDNDGEWHVSTLLDIVEDDGTSNQVYDELYKCEDKAEAYKWFMNYLFELQNKELKND